MEDIKARGELVVGVKTDYPPYGFRDRNGQIVGLEPDLAADLAKRLGVSLKLVGVLSSNRMEFLRNGNIDLIIATLSITDERRREAGFIDPPYYAAGAGLLARHGFHVDEASQIQGQTICAVEGNIYLIELRSLVPEAKVLIFNDVPSAERALLDGQCAALLFNDNLLSYKKQSEPDRFKDYNVIQLLDIDPLLWGIAVKHGEERSALGQYVSQAIIDWHRSEFLLNLEKRWLGSNTGLLQVLNVKWTAAMAPAQKTEFGTPIEARDA
jgi:polar amino acid transport system substrate-binding protein